MGRSRRTFLGVLSVVIAVTGAVTFGLGSPGGERGGPAAASAAEPDVLPTGCGVGDVQLVFEDFVKGVNRRERGLALSRVAPRRWLQNGLAIAAVTKPHRETRFVLGPPDSARPGKIYRAFAGLRGKGWRFSFLGAKVYRFAADAPDGGPMRIPPGVDARERAVQFQFAIGMRRGQSPMRFRMLTGKGGMQCPQGRFYMWASGMDANWSPYGVCPGFPDMSPRRWQRPPAVCAQPPESAPRSEAERPLPPAADAADRPGLIARWGGLVG